MSTQFQDLVRFLSEISQDAARAARLAEAEELGALRDRVIARQVALEQARQLDLPLEIKQAA